MVLKQPFRNALGFLFLIVGIPAHGLGDDPCQNDSEAFCYSTVDIDSNGNAVGTTVTILPSWYGPFGLAAFSDGVLMGPNLLAEADAYDDGTGYSEADNYGSAVEAGDVGEYGDHWVLGVVTEPSMGRIKWGPEGGIVRRHRRG